ncbi:uncharacterized protein C8Q71DRAFT_859423 [Rhodofomes roseus]|uniref:C2H2-type domain-containing protein n=1 Tax=Rhodofomes roseus TaxID=34475 RepID=A0ABQ8KAK2_9APHY|nr:uncharacterized protein C8Q71DRAFT_859423 [Rhodofomes roseus]KAH9834417.1 hypothetical protein C8Q71DRAFT_859423 [Rhodofomes roseus]
MPALTSSFTAAVAPQVLRESTAENILPCATQETGVAAARADKPLAQQVEGDTPAAIFLRILEECAKKQSEEERGLRQSLDVALPMLGIDPRLTDKAYCASIKPPPPPTATKAIVANDTRVKRERDEDEVVAQPSQKRARTSKADPSLLACPWKGCSTEGAADPLWQHLRGDHGCQGRYPRPTDDVRCEWEGCVFAGTSDAVVRHFKDVHNAQHDSEEGRNSRRAPAEGEKENTEGDANPTDDHVVCRIAGCNQSVKRGRSFRRHAYGMHWHHPDHMFWCVFCGKWKRVDENRGWRRHTSKCIEAHLEDYGKPETNAAQFVQGSSSSSSSSSSSRG